MIEMDNKCSYNNGNNVDNCFYLIDMKLLNSMFHDYLDCEL